MPLGTRRTWACLGFSKARNELALERASHADQQGLDCLGFTKAHDENAPARASNVGHQRLAFLGKVPLGARGMRTSKDWPALAFS